MNRKKENQALPYSITNYLCWVSTGSLQDPEGEIGSEMADALCDRLHNMKECIKHPFKKEKREDMRVLKHHWE